MLNWFNRYSLILLTVAVFNSCKSENSPTDAISEVVKGYFTSIQLDNQPVELTDSVFIFINPSEAYFEIEKDGISCKFNYEADEQIGVKDNVAYKVHFKDENNCLNQTGEDPLLLKAFKALKESSTFEKMGNKLRVTGEGIEMLVDIIVISKPLELPEDILDVESENITISTTTCLGHCPSYEASIYKNGVIDWNGKKFTAVSGIELYKEDTTNTNKLFEFAEQMGFQDVNTTSGNELNERSIITIEYDGKKVIFREKDKIDAGYEELYKKLVDILKSKELI